MYHALFFVSRTLTLYLSAAELYRNLSNHVTDARLQISIIVAKVKYGGIDLQSLFGLPCIQLYTQWLRPCNSPPSPASDLIYEGAIGSAKIGDISM